MPSKEIWPFLFFLGLLFFDWPLLRLVRTPLPYYLYAVWALFILVVGLITATKNRRERG